MTDKTDSKEREALAAYLKDCDDHAIVPDVGGAWHAAFQAGRASVHIDLEDLATASAQGFRDGVASLAASAGSEPVAYAMFADNGNIRLWSKARIPHPDAKPLYLHPSPPEGMVGGWIAIPGAMPEPDTPVLLDIGKKYPIRAMWAAKHTVEAADDDTDWAEYDEATDTHYCPEGWYEWNEHEETHWAVTETPRAWAPLPPTSSADSRKGG